MSVLVNMRMAKEKERNISEEVVKSISGDDSNALSDEATLEHLIAYSVKERYLKPLSKCLIDSFGDLEGVLSADFKNLSEIEGMDSHTATLLKLVDHISSSRWMGRSGTSATKIQTSKQQNLLGSEIPLHPKSKPIKPKKRSPPQKKKTKARSGIFTNAVLKEAIGVLPELPDTEDLEETSNFLKKNLPFSAENTRRRYAPYITSRLFADGRADQALRSFAKIYAGRQELRDVCYYRFCKAEPLMVEVTDDLLIPSMGYGKLERSRIRDYLADKFPSSKSTHKCARAIIDALTAAGIAQSDRQKISFRYREPTYASLAFIVHEEHPEPGMYEISELEQSPVIRAMLWNPGSLLQGLYELRNRGMISKISEIDSFRQFTTRYSPDELAIHLKREAKMT